MNKKIKQARRDKVPFLLIAGDREKEDRTVTVSTRGKEEQESMSTAAFAERAAALVASRALGLD
jgi:threonyl-tRNA synthetase